jgi:hypothetical protein
MGQNNSNRLEIGKDIKFTSYNIKQWKVLVEDDMRVLIDNNTNIFAYQDKQFVIPDALIGFNNVGSIIDRNFLMAVNGNRHSTH